jgi:hypothetical protein
LAVLAIALPSAGARAATGPSTIRITDVEVTRTMSHPIGGGRAGSVETIGQRLYNPSLSRKPIGRSVLVCTYTAGRDRSCVGTYILPRGSLVVAGALQTRLLYELPVVGGTGIYADAHGTLTVTATHVHPRHEVLLFRLVA